MATLTKGETFTLSCTARPDSTVQAKFGGPEVHTVNGTLTSELQVDPATGTQAQVWVVNADTTAWALGNYGYELWVTFADGTKRIALRGNLVLLASFSALPSGSSAVSKLQTIVDSLESMIAGNAPDGVKKYKINNRELERYSAIELLSLLKYWRGRLLAEKRRASGELRIGRRIEMHF
jgi:hypothetical protein